ncbi:hypothetical protein [Acinetobacter phage Ab69]|nr:hypothetical protein [Acinetobacter phage Ab69]
MAQMIALNAVKRNDVPCLFISGEMAQYELTSRIVSAVGRIPFDNIQSAKWKLMILKDGFKLPHMNCRNTNWILLIRQVLQSMKFEGRLRNQLLNMAQLGVIVDYIQLLNDPSSKINLREFRMFQLASIVFRKMPTRLSCYPLFQMRLVL